MDGKQTARLWHEALGVGHHNGEKRTVTPARAPLQAELIVRGRLGLYFGDTRIRLLEAVGVLGSITRAAKAVPLSYKAAWDAIDDMNNLASRPLVLRTVGGRHGGGAALTPFGVKMIALYRVAQREHAAGVAQLEAALQRMPDADVGELGDLLARLSVRTSARNQFVGTVEVVQRSEADVDVALEIRIDEAFRLTAVTTTQTIERLELAVGATVVALVPATAVFVSTEPGLLPSTRNVFEGRVVEVHRGTVNADVTVGVPSERTLTATVTRDAADALDLRRGAKATMLFKASSLLLQRIEWR